MLHFIDLDYDGLKLLKAWFKDKQVLKRLGGTLPLEIWFEYVRKNPNYFSWIVYEKDLPIGKIDLEKYADHTATISILSNPAYRNKGYGRRMLTELFQQPELFSVQAIVVGIEQDHYPSLHLFRQFGFSEGEKDHNGFITFTYHIPKTATNRNCINEQ